MFDDLDYKILEQLTINGRVTWAELASKLHLSAPSIAERVKKLEEKGVVIGYSAKLDYQSLGYAVVAFIAVNLLHPKYIDNFLNQISILPEVEECHHIAGEDDYLLKVRCKTTQHLDAFLNGKLKLIKGVSRTRTTIVLSSTKEINLNPNVKE
jgi:Lrp/AsnC family leucine-responsive transcriptional regulator